MATVLETTTNDDPSYGKPLSVGFVLHVMQTAGAEVLVRRIIESAGASIQPTIFCLDALGDLGEQLVADGIDVHVLNRRPGIDWDLPKRFARAIRQRNIELLHAHQYTPFFYSALARMRGARCKIVFSEHGRHYPDTVSAKRRWGNRFILRRFADAANACSQFSGRALWENDGFLKSDVGVIPNGVDTDYFRPADDRGRLRRSLGLDQHRAYLACVARFHPVKDHPTLIRAFSQVAREVPNADLLLVGDGPDRHKLEALAAEVAPQGRIRFLGIRRDVREILAAVDGFVLTSLSEAASLTLLESLSCGCPAVVTDVGGNGEIVREGVEGFFAARGDVAGVSQALITLLGLSQREWALLSQRCRARVVDGFSQESTVHSYLELYRQVTHA